MHTAKLQTRKLQALPWLFVTGMLLIAEPLKAQTTLDIGIGIQNTTTNTVTAGIVIQQLGLLDKYLPKTGKYKDIQYTINWQNFTSGPPITNGMIADKIQIGMMGDYPLLVNGATGEETGNNTQLVSIIAYNAFGSGNGVVVPKDSPYHSLEDLKGKTVSVPFGSAAHGMLLQALQARGLPENYWHLISQSPEVGSTSLQEKRIDAHADFVPFTELLPFRGIARKIFDGAQTRHPTFHGVVIRKDFGEKYPEVVVAYLKAILAANAWLRDNPQQAAEKIAQWTKTDKEVVYIFLGPGGIHTLDPTIKPQWISALKSDYTVLKKINKVKTLNIDGWVNDRYIKQAYRETGLNYGSQLASLDNYQVTGSDPICQKPIDNPKQAGQIWIKNGDIISFFSPYCTLLGVKTYQAEKKDIDTVYLADHALGIKVFANAAYYAVNHNSTGPLGIVPFLLRGDAQDYAAKNNGQVVAYQDVLPLIPASHTTAASGG
ncbi:ABC transporter substrate-binding protein [Gibbsiella dentisursi]|uniref:ABC transporter substrate-binding protein n=1 Tax=Gibbsiella dentisursi TaxID=796890 RepID=A0ABP7KT81_9GAMM